MGIASTLIAKAVSLPWSHWTRQVLAILRLELKRNFFTFRSFFVYLLAFLPIAVVSFTFFVDVFRESVGGASGLYAVAYRALVLRIVIFFASIGVFVKLFRGEVLERTLHFYFLAPVRRELVLLGKYLSGVMMNSVIFGLSTIASYLILFSAAPGHQLAEFVLKGPGLGHLLAYVGVTLLACLGYGAVFLLMGLVFRNPIVPAAVVLGWESINFLLPPFLKKISVIFYLESLCPVPIPLGPFAILADPAPFWMAVPGLLGLTLVILAVSSLIVRQMQILYEE